MKKNLILILAAVAAVAAVCFVVVFYMLLTAAAPATTALPIAIVGCVCALIAGHIEPNTSTAIHRTKDV